MTILCGTDLSDAARAGIDAAAAIAARAGDSDLRLVHVVEPSLEGDVRALVERRLAAEAARLERPVHCEVLTGSPWQTILDCAERTRADLVVVASRGHGMSPLYRIGTTSERVALSATRPVLVVRESRPFQAWARGERPLSVMVGVDPTAASSWALRLVRWLAEIGPCEVVVGHVYRADEARERYGLEARASLVDSDPEAERFLIRDLERAVARELPSAQIRYRAQVGIGRTGDHLVQLASGEGVDLVVVGTHHQRGLARLASTANVVVHFGPTSVIVAPATREALLPEADVPRFSSVLVATDLSLFSNYAVPYAYGLLGDGGGEVHVLHVLSPGTSSSARAEVEQSLYALTPSANELPKATTRVVLAEHPDVAKAILAAVERSGADALCLASHARSGIDGLVHGSVTSRVVAQSHVPVLVVRPPQK